MARFIFFQLIESMESANGDILAIEQIFDKLRRVFNQLRQVFNLLRQVFNLLRLICSL